MIEKQLNSSTYTFLSENDEISADTLSTGAEMYIYLNFCPPKDSLHKERIMYLNEITAKLNNICPDTTKTILSFKVSFHK